MIKLTLPVPPTVNHYYIRTPRGMVLGKKGKQFREDTEAFLRVVYPKHITYTGHIKVFISFYPPDRRRRDVDNILKCLCDSLEKSGVYKNDSQIVDLQIIKKQPEKPGFIRVEVSEIPD